MRQNGRRARKRVRTVTEAIIVSIITGLLTLAGVIVSNTRSDAIQNERIEQLRDEVRRHNQLIDRTYRLEERAALTDAELNRVNHRLEELERGE